MNVVQTNILYVPCNVQVTASLTSGHRFGVVGDIAVTEAALVQAKSTRPAFAAVTWNLSSDNTGTVLNITGPGYINFTVYVCNNG